MLEPRGLYRTDGKRPNGVTMIPWELREQLVSDVRLGMLLHPVACIKALYATREPPPPKLKRVKLSIANY